MKGRFRPGGSKNTGMNIFSKLTEKAEELLESFLTIDLWRLLLCVVIIIAALLLKSFISKCLFRFIKKRLTGKGRAEAVIDEIIDIIDRPIRLVVVTAGISLCGSILRLPDALRGIVTRTVTSLLLIAVFWALLNATVCVKGALERITSRTAAHLDNIAASYIVIALKAVIGILGALSVLQIWVGDITSLIAGLSIGGVAFALAAQDTAANLFGSITVMLDHPFELGEYIEIDGVAGTVERMGLRSTRLRAPDQSLIIIPNKTMSSSNIVNWTKIDRRRVDMTIGVTYSTTSAQLRELVERIRAMLESRDDIRHEGIIVSFSEFGASSLDIMIRFYTLTGALVDSIASRERVNFAIMDIVTDMGLSFAFPSQSVYVESLPASGTGMN